MAIEAGSGPRGARRRTWLATAGGLLLHTWLPIPAWAAGNAEPSRPARDLPAWRLAAAWDDAAGGHYIGWLAAAQDGSRLEVLSRIELPSRAHGLAWEPGGTLLATARRPGDWLLRWAPGAKPQWQWSAADRRFTGHTLREPGGQRLFSVETDLDSGQGLVVSRDARSLDVLAEWPTHGIDPHQLIWGADGHLLLANGGVPSLPETGRAKRELHRMDPSLVRLDGARGELLGQWRLDDPRLSIRHLAAEPGGRVGIALQAEHEEADTRAVAPVLAIFDGRSLRCVPAPRPLAGYGGDVAATREGFVVSTPRAGGLACWSAEGEWQGFEPLAEACALASPGRGVWWAAGARQARRQGPGMAAQALEVAALKLDNHWVLLEA